MVISFFFSQTFFRELSTNQNAVFLRERKLMKLSIYLTAYIATSTLVARNTSRINCPKLAIFKPPLF